MTGANFLTYLKRTFKRTDKDTELYEAITDTVFDMRLRFYPEDFKTRSSALTGCTTVGDYSLTLPTDFGHLIGEVSIRDSNDDQEYPPLEKISIEKYDRLYPYRQVAAASRIVGLPVAFCIYGGEIFVGQCVDKTTYEFLINYTQEDETDIVSGTASVPFTSRYREVVKFGTLMRINNDLELFQEASIYENRYEQGIAKIIANDEINSSSTSPIMYSGV